MLAEFLEFTTILADSLTLLVSLATLVGTRRGAAESRTQLHIYLRLWCFHSSVSGVNKYWYAVSFSFICMCIIQIDAVFTFVLLLLVFRSLLNIILFNMGKKKQKKRSTQEILDSDDELPTEYIELPFVPAYQLENRFESTDEKKDKVHKQGKEQTGHHLRKGLSNDATGIARGYLNKKDTFCLLCLEPSISKKTQQWLFNFLMSKDLQKQYTFLKTCLVVPSWGIHNSSANGKSFKKNND